MHRLHSFRDTITSQSSSCRLHSSSRLTCTHGRVTACRHTWARPCPAAAPAAPTPAFPNRSPVNSTRGAPQQRRATPHAHAADAMGAMPVQPQPQPQEEGGAARVCRRVAVLDCEDAERWRSYTEALWKGALAQEGDAWTVYHACQGQLPTPEEAATFDVIVVGGSHYSVYEADSQPWIARLLELLPQYAAHAGTRVFGCCFGCQAVAQALGGRVGPNPDGSFVLTLESVTPTAALASFPHLQAIVDDGLATAAATPAPAPAPAPMLTGAAGAEGVKPAAAAAGVGAAGGGSSNNSQQEGGSGGGGPLSSSTSASTSASSSGSSLAERLGACSLAGSDSSSGAVVGAADVSRDGSSGSTHGSDRIGKQRGGGGCSSCFRLMESHGDQVLALPPGAVCLAASPSAPHELWALAPNVLACQFHLEFTEPLVLEKIWPRLSSLGRLGGEAGAAASRAVLEAGGQHNQEMLRVVRHFLNHGLA